MSVSLYRKYRPARFEDVIGQDHVARTLSNAIKQDRVSHAYLFTGPRGTGKTSTAKILAMALNCDAGQGHATPEPDGTCQHCEAIRRGSSLDVVEMDAASNRGIDDIRDLRDKVHFAPVESRMKVYIVDEVHMLTSEAFNALLKTLEEPPAHAVFVLATTEPHKVPATILSRCQRFDFRRPSIQEVVSVLGSIAEKESIQVTDASLAVIARAAGGSFRDAIGTLDQLATYCGGQISLEETLDILGVVQHDLLYEIVNLVDDKDTQGSLLFVERLNQSGTDYNQFMKDLLSYLRDLYVVKHTESTPPTIALSEEQLDLLRTQANQVTTSEVVGFIDLLGEALRSVRQGSDPRLELELSLIKMTAFRTGREAEAENSAPRPRVAEAAPAGRQAAPAPRVAPSPPPAARPATTQAAAAVPAAASGEPAAEAAASPETGQRGKTAPEAAPKAEPPRDEEKPRLPHAAGGVAAEIEHLKRAWPMILDDVKRRQAALYAILSEGEPDSLKDNELVIKFPASRSFQAGQVSREDNRRVISEVVSELTGQSIRVSTRLAGDAVEKPEASQQDARILSKDELIRMLKQEFDAQMIDDGPTR